MLDANITYLATWADAIPDGFIIFPFLALLLLVFLACINFLRNDKE